MCCLPMTTMLFSKEVEFNYLPLNLGWPHDLFWPMAFGAWDAVLLLEKVSTDMHHWPLLIGMLVFRVPLSYKEAQVGPLVRASWNLPYVYALDVWVSHQGNPYPSCHHERPYLMCGVDLPGWALLKYLTPSIVKQTIGIFFYTRD